MAYVQYPDGRKEVMGYLNASDGVYTSARPDSDGTAVTDVFQKNAYDEKNDMMKINSMQLKWRAGFTGTALNPNKWDVVQVGEGQSIVVSNGELQVNAGVVANSETIIVSKAEFSVPHRLMAHVKLSQRIINQEFFVELISIDRETGELTSDSRAGWLFDGVTPTQAKYTVNGGDQPALTSPASTVITTATPGAIFEVEPTADETWFFTRSLDATTGRSNSYVRNSQIPNPNLKYKLQIRIKNGATAPASNTTFGSQFMNISDYAELTAEITAGRGSNSPGQAIATMPVTLPTLSTVTTVTTAYVAPKILAFTENVANITVATPISGTPRDATATATYAYYRLRIFADQPLKIEVYAGNVATLTGNRVQQTIVVPANTMVVEDVPLVGTRYVGIKATNTGTATTTACEILSMLLATK